MSTSVVKPQEIYPEQEVQVYKKSNLETDSIPVFLLYRSLFRPN